MNKYLRGIFILFVVVICSINLSAFVSSRIEGVVVDKETGKPIEGAEVRLCESFSGLPDKETYSRSKFEIFSLILKNKFNQKENDMGGKTND